MQSGKLANEQQHQHQLALDPAIESRTPLKPTSSINPITILKPSRVFSDEPYKPILYPIKPYHERLKAYQLARKRIFCDSISSNFPTITPTLKVKRNTRRLRDFYAKLRKNLFKFRKSIDSINSTSNDIRPFIEIEIFGMKLGALLDSGASISCICGKAATEFLSKKIPFKKFTSFSKTVDTAGGNSFPILGSIETDK